MKELLQKFLKDNQIFGFVERDRFMKCFYVTMKTEKRWITEYCWDKELADKDKFEEWKKITLNRLRGQ